jgi:hypothetical protein
MALYAPSTPLSTSSTTQRQPVFVRPHQGRVEKHGASQGTFNKWKKKLRPSSLKKLSGKK